jgi:uncharacterized protein YjbJ (UPF0337 family)
MSAVIDKAKGKIKRAAGKLVRSKKLQREGKVDEARGAMKGAVASVRKALKKATKR